MQEVAKEFPQQLYFPFRLSQESYKGQGRGQAQQLEPLLQNPQLAAFAAALNDLTFPAQRWEAWRLKIHQLLESDNQVF